VRRIINMLVIALFITSIGVNVAGANEYKLDAGDVLTIGVWGFEELQGKELVVRPDGKVNFPLVGEIQAAGVSTAELTTTLTSGLSEYVKNPQVTVNIFKFHTTRVYVLGEIAKPGMYELQKQHNLLDAIGAAGSYTKEAAKKKVTIIRKDQQGEPLKVNLMNIWEKGDMTQNYVLNDGDVVFLSDNGRIDIPSILGSVYQLKATVID
jgi:polysaccharide export outer membrane protein